MGVLLHTHTTKTLHISEYEAMNGIRPALHPLHAENKTRCGKWNLIFFLEMLAKYVTSACTWGTSGQGADMTISRFKSPGICKQPDEAETPTASEEKMASCCCRPRQHLPNRPTHPVHYRSSVALQTPTFHSCLSCCKYRSVSSYTGWLCDYKQNFLYCACQHLINHSAKKWHTERIFHTQLTWISGRWSLFVYPLVVHHHSVFNFTDVSINSQLTYADQWAINETKWDREF